MKYVPGYRFKIFKQMRWFIRNVFATIQNEIPSRSRLKFKKPPQTLTTDTDKKIIKKIRLLNLKLSLKIMTKVHFVLGRQ